MHGYAWQQIQVIRQTFHLIRFIFLVNHQGLVLSTMSNSKEHVFMNACIVYQHNRSVNYGVIQKIFHLKEKNMFVLKTKPLINHFYDYLVMKSRKFVNENLICGELSHAESHFISAVNFIEKACLYNDDQTYFMVRFPNLYESSWLTSVFFCHFCSLMKIKMKR